MFSCGAACGRRRTVFVRVDQIFHALKARAPHVLIDLRDRPGDDSAQVAATWAADYDLAGPDVIRYAAELREFWAAKASRGDTLQIGIVWLTGVYDPPTDADREWEASQLTNPHVLPNPKWETLQHWLVRAEELYKERAKLVGPTILGDRGFVAVKADDGEWTWRPKRDYLPRQCEWFVDVHINKIPPGQVAAHSNVHREAVELATPKIAKLIGVRRQSRPRGRPKRSPNR